MKLFLTPLRWAYSSVRRLGIVDVRSLLHAPCQDLVSSERAEGYEIRMVPMGELAELTRAKRVPHWVGDYRALEHSNRRLIAAFNESRIVSFVWIASRPESETNESDSWHPLGMSIEIPKEALFVYNAWTDPSHRGEDLVASLLRWALHNGSVGPWSFATMIDWTDREGVEAFHGVGMKPLGTVIRLGRGPLQVSFLPAAATSVGLHLGNDARGVKLAL